MPNYEVVSQDVHKNLRWNPINDYTFAARDALSPLVMQEAPMAALHLPIAFTKTGEHFGLFAVQGLEAGSNYLVDAAGQWLAAYIPATYRAYPFALGTSEDQQQLLCIDSDSGLINSTEGYTFFDEQGAPGKQVQETLDFLSQVAANRQATQELCLLLEEFELLEPWLISVKKGDKEVPVAGLFRVNEAKFNTLEADALLNLRDKGALPLIFCQLISIQNLPRIM